MIPSSPINFLLVQCFVITLATAMELPRSSSGTVHNNRHERPQGAIPTSTSMMQPARSFIPASPSMAFPPAKNDRPEQSGSLRGSLIKKVERSTSGLMGKQVSLDIATLRKPLVPESKYVPRATSEPLDKKTKELIYNKPIYTISYDEQELLQKVESRKIITLTVSIQGRCDTIYRVPHLRGFKADDGHLELEEILLFIAKVSKYSLTFGGHMNYKERLLAASRAFEYIQKNKNEPGFNVPFYLVRTKDDTRMCVFESELQEKNNVEAV